MSRLIHKKRGYPGGQRSRGERSPAAVQCNKFLARKASNTARRGATAETPRHAEQRGTNYRFIKERRRPFVSGRRVRPGNFDGAVAWDRNINCEIVVTISAPARRFHREYFTIACAVFSLSSGSSRAGRPVRVQLEPQRGRTDVTASARSNYTSRNSFVRWWFLRKSRGTSRSFRDERPRSEPPDVINILYPRG